MPYTLSNQTDSELMNSCMLELYNNHLKFYIEEPSVTHPSEWCYRNDDGTYTVKSRVFSGIKDRIVHFNLFEIRERTGSMYGRSGYKISDRRYDLIEECLKVARALYICDGKEPTIQERKEHSDYTRLTKRFF